MLDIKFIRENVELVREAARKKRIKLELDRLLELETQRTELLPAIEKLRAEQNKVSETIAAAATGEKETLIKQTQSLKKDLAAKEAKLEKIMILWRELMVQVPNIPDIAVPEGDGEKENKEIRREGGKPAFPYPAQNHVKLMLDLELVDLERGVKISGFRGYILKNEAVLLSMAIWRLAFDRLIAKGYVPMIAPSLVRRETLLGTGYLPQGAEDLYKTQDGEFLAGTAEVSAMGYHSDEILDKKDLPKKFLCFS